ncbi:uncharacterized protein LOC127256384 [Andrographis paniculata]|uniref:uncharacterized protein LOC127256384 n=1 Tax=Andrographis paniculata TaxID=175694 RepID=UPI0021E94DC7|nr:uncharacterized protein LOC127256384 [Andrographis paniculata]XP_051138321.1 uncharacterized protein LOC127256384 [Andrographis paniculata]XP_051138322.1 uncharacterized protein LOC127256384 [Andrographis paniculata]XP_051138324.1 uncharacterized protein LOC127256384 [Andrographis paniculata]XP_051138325.1 uncharacterized protein LOC127256384 [Andrographis paniculata]XP_051138326.1 uncharacterized protein LOC127256384 [Andrographis paniculata]XP_051138327.1 uncharacterized protein LOC12725
MPVAKIGDLEASNATKPEGGSDLLDNFIRQAITTEPLLPFMRAGDSTAQWMQLLQALDQPDLPGWPLLTPLKVQMQKCEKCSREFCSPINYRRHSRVHRRSLNVKKESRKDWDLLAAYWDKLSLEEAKEVVSFDNVMLKEIPGSSVIRALASTLRKPAVWTLPQVYVRAGATLLDIIQAKPARLPISSHELFSILDDASEKTFLCAGTADSVQKYVFDGETAKNSLELKNLIATCSFLFEQQLVKAWIADKDAEALRCHKLLVEEEEAAQKRQAAILAKKRQKKLLQKEQRVREQFDAPDRDSDSDVAADAAADRPAPLEASIPSSSSDSSLPSPDVQTNPDAVPEFEPPQTQEPEKDIEPQVSSAVEHFNNDDARTNEYQTADAKGPRHHPATGRWHGPKNQKSGWHAVRSKQNHQSSKPDGAQKFNPTSTQSTSNGTKVWTKKIEPDSDANGLKPPPAPAENSRGKDESNCEVLIGSIPVTIKTSPEPRNRSPDATGDNTSGGAELAVPGKKKAPEKLSKPQSGTRQMLWRPVSRGGETKSLPAPGKADDRIVSTEASVQLQSTKDDVVVDANNRPSIPCDGNGSGAIVVPYSSSAALEFLEQRYKEALASDHLVLVLDPSGSDLNPTGYPEKEDAAVLDNGENQGAAKSRKKPEKKSKIKYVPKQQRRSAAME